MRRTAATRSATAKYEHHAAEPTKTMSLPLHASYSPSAPVAMTGGGADRRSRRRRRPMATTTMTSPETESADAGPAPGRRRPPSSRLSKALSCTMMAALAMACTPAGVSAHGYLQTPRSRNLVAYQDKNYEAPDVDDPKPEDCPHCLNRGGTMAQCGILYGTHEGTPWERNYDAPLSLFDEPMRPNLQGVYREGSIIEVEVLVTTHHKGHFEFSVCPIDGSRSPMPIPTEECFARHKLEFVSDELYGAPKDPNYPERAYIAPASVAHQIEPVPGVQPVVGAYYKMKFQLPEGIAGDLVLLQWYYLTANSCKHEGYADYDFPETWGNDVKLYPGLPDCGTVPPDGNGVPEQFWNCAEIMIVGKGGSTTPLGSPTTGEMTAMEADAAPAPDTPRPTQAPTPWTPCQNSGSTYYEATEDCTGYYICNSGVQGEIYYCSGGNQLYDEAKQMCNWADEVTCSGAVEEAPLFDESGNPLPTQSPTPSPTAPPNDLLAWDRNAHPRGHDKTIIGYYASWQWYDRNGLAEPAAFDYTKITRANFAFFQITEEGYIFGTDEWADPITLFGFYDWMSEEGTVPKYCSWDEPNAEPTCMAHKYEEGLIYLAHQAGAEVYPSIGGWSLSDPFPPMAANPEARANFARQCVKLIKSYNFDGIDLDWEYPGYEPHSGTPEDTVNFNLLLDDVRAALDELGAETGRFYGLTAALPCGPSIIDNQDIAHVGATLTELNLMTYDFHGSWNEKTGVNAPLYDQDDSPQFSVHGCVNNWLEGGAPREKINIGWPFYGRSFLGAQHLYETHEGGDESTWWADEGVPQYYNIMDKMDEMESYRDDQTMTQIAFGETGMVSWDDERAICDKTEYAQVHDLNGYIIWELSGDLMPDLSTPLLDAGNAKLLNPDLDCASLDLSTYIAELIGDAHPQTNSASAASKVVFYPDFGGAVCLSDGLQSEWLQPSEMFTSLEDCCNDKFDWNPNCIEDSPATPELPAPEVAAKAAVPVHSKLPYYPSATKPECLADGQQPSWMTLGSLFDTEEECCEKSFPTQDCVGKSVHIKAMLFYPALSGSMCLSDGKQPSWLNAELMFESEEECCEHNFPGQTCVGKSKEEKPLLYYPSQGGSKCVRDGKQPEWLSSDSMFETQEECCKHHFEWSQNCVTIDMMGGPPRPEEELVVSAQTRPTELGPTEPLPAPPSKMPTDPTPQPTDKPLPPPPTPRPTDPSPPTKVPSRNPTPRPTQPQTKRPTGYPTPNPTNTKRPTRYPTPQPSHDPTMHPTLNAPTAYYSVLQTQPTIAVVQEPDPTRRPTRRPRPQRPRPGTSPSGASPIAASFIGSPTGAFTTLSEEKPAVVQVPPNLSKGQEQSIGLNIKNQINQMVTQKAKKKGKKKGSRGEYKKGAKKKANQKVGRGENGAKKKQKKAGRGKKKQQGKRQQTSQNGQQNARTR